ncbi:MAG: cbb3-type cytochrome oxidase assembly protein CcoS [Betaproteobacteria bacterium]|jgi:cbb3-type cytochrome oxidase maturation protein|uniref:Cytochrome oxidase maturation protein, cbb3-type n=1 Tax=Thiomonas intermedia (strain K12) TaxID=75379 RepID=D5WZP7_THIK1|nr:cbb3-type cytochrome oxidase assembly protein CcoS [Thiomonas sp.]MDE2269824.1 cbb3-type cytochrome oxidase assembly protein CcoS [Betaproteobacteria bacterium]OZB73608.1 MAG: cbb3-type cytochrome oxidase assembly protein CcoS [Thiomonas sp. 14-64-326]
MEGSLLILIPISVLLVLLIVGVLWWAARSGQFDDMEGPAHAILMDDDKPKPESLPDKDAERSVDAEAPQQRT